MNHHPRKPRQDADNPIDSQERDPSAETDEAVEERQEVEASHARSPAMADEALDASQFFDSPPSIPISANDVADTADVPPQSEPRDASARVAEELGGDVLDVTASDFVGPAFDDPPGTDSIAIGSGFLPRAVPVAPPIDDLVLRPGTLGFIQQLPYFPGRDSDRGRIQLLGDTNEAATSGGSCASAADLESRTKALLSPTSDGGPPLARPIVLVSLEDSQQRKIIDESLAAISERDAKACKECAQEAVDYANWRDYCELRALTGNY